MTWEKLMEDLILALVPIITAIGSYVLVKIARFLTMQTDNLLVKAALENLEKIIFNTVSSLTQTIVDDLKEGRADRKLSLHEAKLVKNKALYSIDKQLSSRNRKILQDNFCCLDELIDNFIEQKVVEVKMLKGKV